MLEIELEKLTGQKKFSNKETKSIKFITQ